MQNLCFFFLTALLHLSNASSSNKPSFLINSFILNGDEAKPGEIPHQLMMETKQQESFGFSCGAVLINKLQALTAARCLDALRPKDIKLYAGLHDQRKKNDSQLIHIEKFVVHPGWGQEIASYSDDIAILTFTAPVVFSKYVQPIAWNDNYNNTFADQKCVISGWGVTDKGKISETLQKANINILSNDLCKKMSISVAKIYDGHVCVHGPMLGACTGDSGGPLTCMQNGKPILVGVASWAHRNSIACDPKYPSVYARTSKFRLFIYKHLVKNETISTIV